VTFRRRFDRFRRRVTRALRPSRILASLGLLGAFGVAVWLLVLVVSENAVPTGTTRQASPPPSATTRPTPTTAPKATTPKAKPAPVGVTVPLGVYAGPGSPVAAVAFSADAGAPVPFAFDYIDGASWRSIADPIWFVQRWTGSGFRMIWGVPMLPTGGGTSLAAGATGAFNLYFAQLGSTLVGNGMANSVLMIGWDPQDSGLPWGATSNAAAADYVAYWRQIVTALRAVPGEQFQFAWDSAPGTVPPSALYPGNAYVDVVATDAFDLASAGSGTSWPTLASSAYGPNWFATFSLQHHKPLMIAKWGVVPTSAAGGGDNATYVSQFLRWADKEHLFAAVTWDYGSWAVTGGDFPRAAQTLKDVAEAGAVAPLAKAVPA